MLPTLNFTVFIEQFQNTTDIIDLTHFPEITSILDLKITAGSAIVEVTPQNIVRLLNLQPSDVSERNFRFAAKQQVNEPPATQERNKLVTYTYATLLGMFFIAGLCHLGQCYAIFQRRLSKEELAALRMRREMEKKGGILKRYQFIREIQQMRRQSVSKVNPMLVPENDIDKHDTFDITAVSGERKDSDQEGMLDTLHLQQHHKQLGDIEVYGSSWESSHSDKQTITNLGQKLHSSSALHSGGAGSSLYEENKQSDCSMKSSRSSKSSSDLSSGAFSSIPPSSHFSSVSNSHRGSSNDMRDEGEVSSSEASEDST